MYRFLEYTVGQYMTQSVQTVTPQVSLRELESLFEQHDFNAFPVVDKEASKEMTGLVTKFDFLKVFAFSTGQLLPHYDELMNQTVQDVMVEAVVCVAPDTPLTRALQHMVNLKARSLPVVAANGQLVGVIAREDIMRALKDATQAAWLGSLAKNGGDHAYSDYVVGNPFFDIGETAKKDQADLIVMGSHGRTGLSHILIGSVAERVVRHAPCPVLVVGGKATS